MAIPSILKPGMRISYFEVEATVLEILDEQTILVKSDFSNLVEKWVWELDGVECKILSESLLSLFDAQFTKPEDISGDEMKSHDNSVWWNTVCEVRNWLKNQNGVI